MFIERWYLSLMHIAFPPAMYFRWFGDGSDAQDLACFILGIIALVPLAERLGFVTEQLAMHCGDFAAGLINVSLGNVPELIMTVVAIVKNETKTALELLFGGVLSNLLLVLGLSLLAGGVRFHVQYFNIAVSLALLAALLFLALAVFGIGAMASSPRPDLSKTEVWDQSENISMVVSIITFVYYVCFIYFSLITHKSEFDGTSSETGRPAVVKDASEEGLASKDAAEEEEEEEEEEDVLGLWGSLAWMAVLIVFISFISDGIVDSVGDAAKQLGASMLFLNAIVVPNVGNAPEHAVSITMAMANKMNLVISIAVGSAAQLGLMLLPIIMIESWVDNGTSKESLHVPLVMSVGLLAGILFAILSLQSGKTSWHHGAGLIFMYLLVCCLWWYEPYWQVRDPSPLAETNRLTAAPAVALQAWAAAPAHLRANGAIAGSAMLPPQ